MRPRVVSEVSDRCPVSTGSVLDTNMLALDQDSLQRRSLARNQLLFRQGDKVTAIYFIEEGRLRLERRTFDGRLLFLGTTSAGEFFVAAALFSDTFHCDAVATEPSRVRASLRSYWPSCIMLAQRSIIWLSSR